MPLQLNSKNTTLNPRVRKILMEMDERPSLKSSNSVMTDMYGSGRVEKYVASGNSGSYPSESTGDYLSVSGKPEKFVDVSTGGNLKNIAKKVMRVAKPHAVAMAKAVQPMVEQALAKKVKKLAGGKVNRLKKAERFTDYAVNTVKKGIGLASLAKSAFGGAKPKKGSPEMAAKMAALRAMRKK
jgi:hypothetical protein